MVEFCTFGIEEVVGSNPTGSTIIEKPGLIVKVGFFIKSLGRSSRFSGSESGSSAENPGAGVPRAQPYGKNRTRLSALFRAGFAGEIK